VGGIFPKSVTAKRLKANLEIFDFELYDDEMARIESLDRGERVGPDPDTFDMGV
jgi:2,5-diketo-D-gluconate reductase A